MQPFSYSDINSLPSNLGPRSNNWHFLNEALFAMFLGRSSVIYSSENVKFFRYSHQLKKAILLLLWSIWFCREVFCFCREVFGFAIMSSCFCPEVFGFALRFLVSPWGILFLPWRFWFCRDSCGPPYPTYYQLFSLSYKTPTLLVKVTIWLWGIHSSHNHLTLGYPF